MQCLAKLIEVKDLRTIWPNEAQNFTPWLAEDDNIALLSDAIGIDITVNERESSVGNFSSDIFATETGTDKKIIIENQLGDTDHDHLGKLITYASGKSANTIIWIVKKAREEHKAAIEWLNNHTDEEIGFFLCEIKLYKIGDSKPAVKFEVVEKPNDWTKEIKKNEATSETELKRYDYWCAFQDYAFKNSEFAKRFNRRKPNFDHWLDFGIGSSAYHIRLSQIRPSQISKTNKEKLVVDIWIDNDKELFKTALNNKDKIEKESGLYFDWRELPDRKASRIVIEKNFTLSDDSQWNTQFDWVIDIMIKMKDVFNKYLK